VLADERRRPRSFDRELVARTAHTPDDRARSGVAR
jgi:hypothetical protein